MVMKRILDAKILLYYKLIIYFNINLNQFYSSYHTQTFVELIFFIFIFLDYDYVHE